MEIADMQNRFDELLKAEDFESAETLLRSAVEDVPAEDRKNPFGSTTRIKREMLEPHVDESFGLDLANALSRKLRNAKYAFRVGHGYKGIRIVDEGDSWFQYPLILEDIVDVVSEKYPIYSLSGAGDTLDEMLAIGEYRKAIIEKKPDILMLSAGGNDILGEGAFVNLIKPYKDGASPKDLVRHDRLAETLSQITAKYRAIFSEALKLKPNLQIVTHGYDLIHPREDGKWLGKPLKAKNIPLGLGREVVSIILRQFNHQMSQLADSQPNSITHINLLGVADRGASSWHDEIHPKNAGFARAAAKIIEAIDDKIAHGEAISNGPIEHEAYVNLRNHLEDARKEKDERLKKSLKQHRDTLTYDSDYSAALKDIEELLGELALPDTNERLMTRKAYDETFFGNTDEAILGEDNLEEFSSLLLGPRAGKSVGKVYVRDTQTGLKGSGTGFIVGPNLLLTNNHVLQNRQIASDSLVAFDYELDIYGMPRNPVFFRLNGEVFFTSEQLDFSLVGIEPTSLKGDRSLTEFGVIAMLPISGKAIKHEHINIIQHPSGRYKKVAFRGNTVIGPKGDFLYYRTDTQPGSSGAPCFNERWQLAALHHNAIKDPQDPEKYIANRGIRISSICSYVSTQAEANAPDAKICWQRIKDGFNGAIGWGPAELSLPSSPKPKNRPAESELNSNLLTPAQLTTTQT